MLAPPQVQSQLRVLYIFCAVFFAVSLLWDCSGLDVAVSRQFATAEGFALRDHWFLKRVMHEGMRWLAWVVLGWMILFVSLTKRPNLRVSGCWAIAGMLLAVIAVQWLKWISLTSCPWNLQLFGGSSPYVSHWNFLVNDGGPGRCFPSGHAATGFCFLPAWMALQRHLRYPNSTLFIVVLASIVLGMVQVARGAHFVSHVLWTGSACAFVALIIGLVRKS